jgi:hypothetical protein
MAVQMNLLPPKVYPVVIAIETGNAQLLVFYLTYFTKGMVTGKRYYFFLQWLT